MAQEKQTRAETFEFGRHEITVYDDGDVWIEGPGFRMDDGDGAILDFALIERLYEAAKARREAR